MKVLFDICHPAHFHFFKITIHNLISSGHEVLITSRNKEMTTSLIDDLNLHHHQLTKNTGKGLIGLLKELLLRNFKLFKFVTKVKPDVMIAIGGTFIAQTGFLTRTPSLVFYDTENAKLQNLITYPFVSKLFVPDCYTSWTPIHKTTRYNGFHELAYLHPEQFTPDKNIAISCGLAPTGNTFFIRVVSWQANHDIGEKGWDLETIKSIISYLEPHGKIIISSELPLDKQFKQFMYEGDISNIHHLLYYCRCTITESATMASESAVLGTPALYIAQTGRGYIDQLRDKFKLLQTLHRFESSAIHSSLQEILNTSDEEYSKRRNELLSQTINTSDLILSEILKFRNNSADNHF